MDSLEWDTVFGGSNELDQAALDAGSVQELIPVAAYERAGPVTANWRC